MASQFGVSHTVVSRLLRRHRESRTVFERHCSGRPRKISPEMTEPSHNQLFVLHFILLAVDVTTWEYMAVWVYELLTAELIVLVYKPANQLKYHRWLVGIVMHVPSAHVTICSQRLLSCRAFQPFHYEHTGWRLFQKRAVRTKVRYLRFYYYHSVDTSAGGL